MLSKQTNLCYSQVDECKKFAFANMSGNTYTPFKPLKSKKVKLESQYNFVCSYDFNGDGYVEEIYSRLDQQSAGFLLQTKNKNLDLNYKFYIEDGKQEFDDDGIWIFIVDVVGDATPEIVVFSLFATSTCSLSIIKYDNAKSSFIKRTYGLNELVLNRHMLIKNKSVIHNSYGSQGLFDEIHFSENDFGIESSRKKDYLQTECPHFKIAESVDGGKITYIKPIKCVNLDLINDSEASDVLSYDFNNDGYEEHISYRTIEDKSGTYIRFKMEGGIIHEYNVIYEAGTVSDAGNGVWLYVADVYGDKTPELLIFSCFGFVELNISIYSDNQFIDTSFSLIGENVLYIKNQRLVRDYISDGTYKSYPLTFTGSIKYDITYKNLDPQYKGQVPTETILYVMDDNVRTDQNSPLYTMSAISLEDGGAIVLIDVIGHKLATQQTKDEVEKAQESDNIKTSVPIVKATNEYKTIAGYDCRKYIITTNDENIEVFVTNKINMPTTYYKNSKFKGINGFPMEYTMTSQGMSTTMTAKEVRKSGVNKSMFTIPDDYQKVSPEEFEKMLNGGK